MNHKKKLKAAKDFGMYEGEQLVEKLLQEGYDEHLEVPEIVAFILEGDKVEKINLEELHEMEDEDGVMVYSHCKAFKDYINLESKTNGFKAIDYLKVNAVGCFRVKINSRGEKVDELVGLKLIKEKPIAKTRITPDSARRMNAQIWNKNNIAECSIYYLIAEHFNY